MLCLHLDVVLEVALYGLVGEEVIVGGDVEAGVPGPFHVLRLAAVTVPVVDQRQYQPYPVLPCLTHYEIQRLRAIIH